MRKWIHALTLMLALSAALLSAASTLSIADTNDNDLFAPPFLIPSYRADNVLHWITFDLDANSTVRFGQPQNAGQLQLGDILIVGANAATGITLALANQEGIVFTRLITTGSISLAGNTASFSGSGISRADRYRSDRWNPMPWPPGLRAANPSTDRSIIFTRHTASANERESHPPEIGGHKPRRARARNAMVGRNAASAIDTARA